MVQTPFDQLSVLQDQIKVALEKSNFEEIDNLFVNEGLNLSIETINNLP